MNILIFFQTLQKYLVVYNSKTKLSKLLLIILTNMNEQ